MAAMSPPSNWPHNRLLLALPTRNLKQLLPELEHIRCQREQVLIDADSSLDSIFFLDSGVVSVVAVYSDSGTIEMATIAFLEQVMVSGACNGAHSLTQRLARWLLMMRDRSDGDELPIT